MTPGALGRAGIEERISEIQAKMDQFFGNDSYASFRDALNAAGRQIDGQLMSPEGPGNGPLGIDGLNLVPDSAMPLKQIAIADAQKYGIDPDLYVALINQESSFNPGARSNRGAMGLAQLMPDTAAGLGVTNPMDPAQNLDAGAKYLSQLLDRFGTPELALAAYNAGPNKVEAAGGIPNIPETQDYVSSIMRALAKRRGR